jgi:mRNA-degrading endonuclease YafQ of YafQ-DinJ toxin-antitoxin module
MIFRRTPHFIRQFEKLSPELKKATKKSFKLFEANPIYPYHPSLRINILKGSDNIWEGHVTKECVFTFHMETDDKTGMAVIRFRRIGSHDIYDNP